MTEYDSDLIKTYGDQKKVSDSSKNLLFNEHSWVLEEILLLYDPEIIPRKKFDLETSALGSFTREVSNEQ